jgi:serine/threonine protein kinase
MDLFSLGLILYEFVVGKPVVSGDSTGDVYGERRTILSEISPDVPGCELIKECCREDPSSRPSFSDILDKLREMKYQLWRDVDSNDIEDIVQNITQ